MNNFYINAKDSNAKILLSKEIFPVAVLII